MNQRRAGIHATDPDGVDLRVRASTRWLERGQTVEAVIIVPVVLGLLFLILQAGIWAHARSIALSSAREGAQAAAAYQSDQDPQTVARAALDESAGGMLTDYAVTADSTEDEVTVTVTGRSLSLVPLVQLPEVQQSITVPVQRYVP